MVIATPQLFLRSQDATWDYERWQQLPADGNRYEVIDGVLYMSTSPSFFHQWIVKRLMVLVGAPAEEHGMYYAAMAPIGVIMPGANPVQPDFLLLRQDRGAIIHEGRIYGHPDLIVEVLSPSNPEQDTVVKRAAYARAGVPEYWMVRPATRDAILCWQPDADLGDYAQVRPVAANTVLTSPTLDLQLEIAQLFADAPDTTL